MKEAVLALLMAAAGSGNGSGGSSSTGIYGGSNVNITYWTDGTQTEACSVSKSDVPGAAVGDFIIGKRYGELSIMKAVRENTGMLFGDDAIAIDAATIPTGGTTGQVLRKKSNSDYDFEWATI